MKFKLASENISKKKPPIAALNSPNFSLGFSKKLIRITEIKIRFGVRPRMLKWIKKLV